MTLPKLFIARFNPMVREENNYYSGIETYWNDFRDIVLPELQKEFEIVNSPHWADLGYAFNKDIDTCLRILKQLHNRYVPKEFFSQCNAYSYLTHYKINEGVGYFLPMSISLEGLPDKCEQNGKVIYFGNILYEKQDVFEKLLLYYPEMDWISFSKYHAQNKRSLWVSRREILQEILPQYEYGIGVGRAALEMMAIGMKVIIAGRHYSGAVDCVNFYEHWMSNCNSDVLRCDMNAVRDKKRAEKISRTLFDMNAWKQNYVDIFTKMLQK